MKKKCALIVDDSRTAREILAKKLAAYEIDIVKVESAANAIDYLYSKTPDAVFMDYEMPGMDGFQALRVIKSNPNTATIPVMMYTSKEGGLALGEARALGAIGVLPKQMAGQDLNAVVEQLHLLPDQISLVETFHDESERYQAGVELNYQPQPTANVEYLDEAALKPEKVEYPGEVYDESLFVLKRQTRIFQKDLLGAEQRLTDQFAKELAKLREDVFTTEMREQDLDYPSKQKNGWLLFTNLLVLVFIGFIWWQLNETNNPRQLIDVNTELSKIKQKLASLDSAIESDAISMQYGQSDTSLPPQYSDKRSPIEFLNWAANRGTEFQYGENPYDDFRVFWLSELVEQLVNTGFQGVISLQAHYGNFCLTRSETGGLILAREHMPFNECLFSNNTDAEGFAQSSYQTIGFANFISALTAEEGGLLEVFVDSDAQDDPILPYPESYSVKTAGEWNKIAEKNQRIHVSLYQKTEI